MEKLLCKIECLRQKMYVTALGKDRSHPDVLMASERLDKAINELYELVLIHKAG